MKVHEKIKSLAIVLVFCTATISAQDQTQPSQQPVNAPPAQPSNPGSGDGYAKPPAGAARGVSEPFQPQTYDPSQVTPDQNTLAGAEYFGLGSLTHSHNVLDATISYSQLGEVYGYTGGQSNFYGVSLIGGNLNFSHNWSRYQFAAVYNGGENFNYGTISFHNPYHDVSFIQQANLARWHFLMRDDFVASSGAAFTGSGMGGPGLVSQYSNVLGSSLGSLGQAFLPSETIETGYATRYMNSVLGQAEYSLSRRSTITASGSFGILDFPSVGGYISSHMLNGQLGYDYQLDPKNSVAILGGYGKISYLGTNDSTIDYLANIAYGRKITGRLALQIAGGPMLIRSVSTPTTFQSWTYSVNSALSYAWRRSTATFTFNHGLTAGSGVLMGAESYTFTFSASHQFTRFWIGTVNGGYARNTSLAASGTSSVQFNDWLAGATLGRQIGRHGQFNFNYGLVKPTSPVNCPVASCGVNGYQQTFGMTVNWHLRPMG